VFIAGDVALISPSDADLNKDIYRARPAREIKLLLASAYGPDANFSNHIVQLESIARRMSEGNWVLAKIATVHLSLPDLSDQLAIASLRIANAKLMLSSDCSCSFEKRRRVNKRDVSSEPRVPAGQTGGGEWAGQRGGVGTANGFRIPFRHWHPQCRCHGRCRYCHLCGLCLQPHSPYQMAIAGSRSRQILIPTVPIVRQNGQKPMNSVMISKIIES
jgi:hypothetical protein